MNAWVQVDKLQDAEPVNADTLNRPVDQLASRTDYLKKRLGTILNDGVQSSLILTDVPLVQNDGITLVPGTIVYRDTDGFRCAQAKMHLYDDFSAADSAFTLGILISTTGSVGDVLIYGKLDLADLSAITVANLLQSGEEFRPGRYYLSAVEAGKLTSNPNGPLIYIGSFHGTVSSTGSFSGDSVAYINPQFLDIGTSHVHRAYSLVARPAGTVVDDEVIGYLPIGAVHESDSSDVSSDPGNHYPTLMFSGTWTSTNDINYSFYLEGNTWGNVKLQCTRNGSSSPVKTIDIPAPDVFVDLENGLRVKVLFPEATSTKAYDNLTVDERTWNLSFPHHGKGWVNHSVEAIADVLNEASESSYDSSSDTDDGVTPSLHAAFRGSWPSNDNTVYCLFPSKAYEKTVTNLDDTITIAGTTYAFSAPDSSDSSDSSASSDDSTAVIIKRAGTIEESLHNLAATMNTSSDTAKVFVKENTLIVCDLSLADWTKEYTGIATGQAIVGGTMPVTVVYDVNYYLLGDVITNHPNYTPANLGKLTVTVYAAGATAGKNYICLPGTRLRATAYDYEPNAIYDYVMGLHQEVDYYFPPVPAQAACLVVNGVEMENAALFKSNPTYRIGHDTLYWLESASERRPWPETAAERDASVDPAYDKTMVFYFVVGFQCSTGPVTSIVPAPGSSVKLYTYGTNDEAYTGDLMIDATVDVSVDDEGVRGYNAVKQGRNGRLLAGPVVERIKAGNGIILTQEAGCPSGQGTVTIGLDDGTLRGQFNEIALENAKQEKIGLFPYVSLLGWGSSSNIPSAFTAMMRVPSNLDTTKDYQLQLRLVMFGTVGYSEEPRQYAAGVQLEYNILPDYTDKTNLSLKTGLLIPDNPRTINVPLGHKNGDNWEYKAFDPFVATTDSSLSKEADVRVAFSNYPIPYAQEFSVQTPVPALKPGYLLALRISRVAMTDTVSYVAYTSPVGFLTLEWTLEEK